MTESATARRTDRPRDGLPPRGPRFLQGPGGSVLRSVIQLRELSILLVTIIVAIYFSATAFGFNQPENYHTIAQFFMPWAIIASGEVFLLICGEIDLSAGFTFTLAPFIMMAFYNAGLPTLLSIILAVALCAVIGIVNGVVHTRFGIPSFIVTLGMLFLLEGISLILSGGSPVGAPTGGWVGTVFGHSRWSELVWTVLIVAVMQILLSTTRFGVYTQATGSNKIGAAEAGIKINRIKITCFAMCSTLAGLGGILDGMRVGSFDPTNGGNDTMFLAVASAVIGGTALLGGSGTVVGALIGAALLGIVHDGFNLAGVSANTFDVVLGAAILLAMLLNVGITRLRRWVSR